MSEFEFFLQEFFSITLYFQLKYEPIAKMVYQKYCMCFEILTKNIMRKCFLSFFVNFSVSFQYFYKRVLALKFPLISTEYFA